jgi:hypothetical protein
VNQRREVLLQSRRRLCQELIDRTVPAATVVDFE